MNEESSESELAGTSRLWVAGEVVLVLCIFWIHAGVPVPDVNEPHYLTKAKHYWNPQWCDGDFFLETDDAHHVFYWTFGWLTLLAPLTVVAWIGRLLTWLLLAWSWRRLSYAVVPLPLMSVLSAAWLVALLARTNLAGEWIVGGVEAKGFSYVLVFFGLEALAGGQWKRIWLLLGGASALHVLVGGWSALAAGFCWLCEGRRRPPLAKMLPSLAGGLSLALLGVLPGLALMRGVDAETSQQAANIYVYGRLPHHLAPLHLRQPELTKKLTRSGIALLTFAALAWANRDQRSGRLQKFVGAAVLFAAVGFLINVLAFYQPDFAARLLRYYWFRLYDAALAVGVAILVAALLASWRRKQPRWFAVALLLAVVPAAWHLGEVVYRGYGDPRPPADKKLRSYGRWQLLQAGEEPSMQPDHFLDPQMRRRREIQAVADWMKMCDWIVENTAPDSIFLTPRLSQTFCWYAGRPEVVTHKNIPQDARGIVAWQQRIDDVFGNREDPDSRYVRSLNRQGEQRLRELAGKYGADYVLTTTDRWLNLPMVHSNRSFCLYRLEPP